MWLSSNKLPKSRSPETAGPLVSDSPAPAPQADTVGSHLPLWVTHGGQSVISKSDSELTAALQAAGHVAALGLCFSSFLKIIFTPDPEFGWVRVGSESTLEGLLGTEVTAADLGSEDPAQTPGSLCPRRRSVSLDCSFSISKSRWKISEGHTSVLPLM